MTDTPANTLTDAAASPDITGTPDCPDLRGRPMLFIFALVAYAIWMTLLIIWAIQLHSGPATATAAS